MTLQKMHVSTLCAAILINLATWQTSLAQPASQNERINSIVSRNKQQVSSAESRISFTIEEAKKKGRLKRSTKYSCPDRPQGKQTRDDRAKSEEGVREIRKEHRTIEWPIVDTAGNNHELVIIEEETFDSVLLRAGSKWRSPKLQYLISLNIELHIDGERIWHGSLKKKASERKTIPEGGVEVLEYSAGSFERIKCPPCEVGWGRVSLWNWHVITAYSSYSETGSKVLIDLL